MPKFNTNYVQESGEKIIHEHNKSMSQNKEISKKHEDYSQKIDEVRKLIDETQPEDFRDSMKDALMQVLDQDRFAYLREFMHTPLELLFILRRITSDSLSLNHYQMLYDMLWSMFKNRKSNKSNKRYEFEDYMTLLSFIAYKLQLSNQLSFSLKFINDLESELRYLSFYDDIFGENIVESCIDILDDLAANVGIIKSDISENEKIYTFTVRSYREFLTAYACCHLRVDVNKSRPDPQSIIADYLNDDSWINIINFMLSDLYNHSKYIFDSCLNTIFENKNNFELLKSIIESNHIIGIEQVGVLCENAFSGVLLDDDTKEFLMVCLRSDIASSCLKYLKYFYNKSEIDGAYLTTTAIASIVIDLNKGKNPISSAVEYLTRTTPTGDPDESAIKLGSNIVSIVAKICSGKLDIGNDIKERCIKCFI